MSDPLYTTPCPFDETERCYQITAEGCRNACGVIREKARLPTTVRRKRSEHSNRKGP
jgi:hypothetical protein